MRGAQSLSARGVHMISPDLVDEINRAALPCFIYDRAAVIRRVAIVSSLLDRYFFPVKACPEPEIVRAALETGCGLDLCSAGDVEIAATVGCAGKKWKFTSPGADDRLLQRLCREEARLDADSVEQALRWGVAGATACGLRITAKNPKTLYGAKFGVPADSLPAAAKRLATAGISLEGLHIHDQHTNLTPPDFAARLADNFAIVDRDILRRCRYINIGGSWPMRHGRPASEEDLRAAFRVLRERLAALGFEGELFGEPGRWVVEPCGYWAARVIAVKNHLDGSHHQVVVLDTNTPIPCRPSRSPFVVLRSGKLLKAPASATCDLFGSANTALDTVGVDVRLPALTVGDTVVALGQGAYTRSLIPPFNERERPGVLVWRGRIEGER